jgi:predicted Zn-dependent peptidase
MNGPRAIEAIKANQGSPTKRRHMLIGGLLSPSSSAGRSRREDTADAKHTDASNNPRNARHTSKGAARSWSRRLKGNVVSFRLKSPKLPPYDALQLEGFRVGGALSRRKGQEFCRVKIDSYYSRAAMSETQTVIAAFCWISQAIGVRRPRAITGAILWFLFISFCCLRGFAATTVSKSWSLTNGIRLVSVYFPNSTNVSIFTFSPMGLASDGPNQAQWSHLVEHLVIRSTVPDDLSIANAETLPDHMRLDFYANISNWKEGLSHPRRWLEGVPFTEQTLLAEKPKVKSECDFTTKNLVTHKFALAAWAQGVRHGETSVALKGDVDRASLPEIQAHRDAHLVVLSNVVVCVVGGAAPDEVRAEASRQLEAIQSKAKLVTAVKLHPGRHEMSWDLNARHLVLSWPIPGPDDPAFAPLVVVGQRLMMQFYMDNRLKTLTGMTLAGADLRTPEGSFFYVSASLRADSSFAEVEKLLAKYVSDLSAVRADFSWAPMFGQQLAESFSSLPDLEILKAQIPPNVTMEQVQGNLGLQWGMNEFRYGSRRTSVARNLRQVNAEEVQQAAKKYLSSSNCISMTLQPERH